ncbi:hypothetical protein [Streptomyces sp. NBC_00147]|uniref:hypothetical protein n=1 Tax=Streptomyces sp. NBC_00147 TaxID=2975667 RepID=UPI00324C4ED5
MLTAVVGIVLLATKFLEGAWVVVVAVPLLMRLFARVQRYYILQNSRGLLLAAALRARTDVVVCVVPYRLSL